MKNLQIMFLNGNLLTNWVFWAILALIALLVYLFIIRPIRRRNRRIDSENSGFISGGGENGRFRRQTPPERYSRNRRGSPDIIHITDDEEENDESLLFLDESLSREPEEESVEQPDQTETVEYNEAGSESTVEFEESVAETIYSDENSEETPDQTENAKYGGAGAETQVTFESETDGDGTQTETEGDPHQTNELPVIAEPFAEMPVAETSAYEPETETYEAAEVESSATESSSGETEY